MAVAVGSSVRIVLIPSSLHRDNFCGFVETDSACYRLALRCSPGGGRVNPSSIDADPQLAVLLRPFIKVSASAPAVFK